MVSSPKLGKTEHGVLWRSVVVVPCSNCRDVCCPGSTHLCCVPGRCRSLLDRCAGVGLVAFTSLLELWKSQHFTRWRSLSSNIAWYHGQWRCPPCAHLTDCWSPGLRATQDQMPHSWWDWGVYSSILLKPFWYQLSLTVHYLSTLARWDKDMEQVGELQKKGLILEVKLISSVWCSVRTWYWNRFKTSDSWSLVSLVWLLGGVQMVLSTRRGHL